MNIIICIDDNGGMLFNRRRQSRDKLVLEDMLTMVNEAGGKVWITPFSEKLFAPYKEMCPFITVEMDFLEKAEVQDFCFVEAESLRRVEEKINTLILYRWNRVYPADTYLDIDLSEWKLQVSKEFAGSSHENITKEVYIR